MSNWYYVHNSERIGPVNEGELQKLIDEGTLHNESYIWTKGYEDWERFKNVYELSHILEEEAKAEAEANLAAAPQFDPAPENVAEAGPEDIDQTDPAMVFDDGADSLANELDADEEEYSIGERIEEAAPVEESDSQPEIDWTTLDENEKLFSIKIGLDRSGAETEYGPFNFSELRTLKEQNRISDKTFIFARGMSTWIFIADLPNYHAIFNSSPDEVTETDRRITTRKPFVARLFFHDNSDVFEGICRDVSVGGLQVLIGAFPANVGEEITMNVHPDNTEYSFVAKGTIVRLLEGQQGFSIRFVDLNSDAHNAIEQYVKQAE